MQRMFTSHLQCTVNGEQKAKTVRRIKRFFSALAASFGKRTSLRQPANSEERERSFDYWRVGSASKRLTFNPAGHISPGERNQSFSTRDGPDRNGCRSRDRVLNVVWL